jgi:hypothetical protein
VTAPALLTYVASDGGICVVHADGTHPERVTAKGTKVTARAWSPHGRYLAFGRRAGARALPARLGGRQHLPERRVEQLVLLGQADRDPERAGRAEAVRRAHDHALVQ